jgi:hypothetical protein
MAEPVVLAVMLGLTPAVAAAVAAGTAQAPRHASADLLLHSRPLDDWAVSMLLLVLLLLLLLVLLLLLLLLLPPAEPYVSSQ